ncbi:MAG: carboxymuconolactone decarboxylase family protein [Rhodomicrobium sp.]
MESRIAPAEPPYAPEIEARLARLMPPGVPPLLLFRMLARDKRLFERFMGGGLLDKGNLTLRQREIVIDRSTALCGSEYEWGVHIAFFAERAKLTEAQIASTAKSGTSDPVWTEEERLLLTVCDQLHETCNIDDQTWNALRAAYAEEAILEILMLAGFYRTVSYLTNALRLPNEPYGARFSAEA